MNSSIFDSWAVSAPGRYQRPKCFNCDSNDVINGAEKMTTWIHASTVIYMVWWTHEHTPPPRSGNMHLHTCFLSLIQIHVLLQNTLLWIIDFCSCWWFTHHLIPDYITVVKAWERWERFLSAEQRKKTWHFSTSLQHRCHSTAETTSVKGNTSVSALLRDLIVLLNSLILQIRSKSAVIVGVTFWVIFLTKATYSDSIAVERASIPTLPTLQKFNSWLQLSFRAFHYPFGHKTIMEKEC